MSGFLIANKEPIIIWIGAACTLGIYSILYRENKIYRFFEHLFIGLAAGWAVALAWGSVLKPLWFDRIFTEGRWWWFFLLPVGLLLYLVYSKRLNWMSRITIGLLLGIDAGQQFQQFSGQYYNQISSTFKPLVPQAATAHTKAVSLSGAINNWLFLLILICVMSYFFFSFEQKHKLVQRTALTGRWLLMIAFGAIFGSTIMARMALFISRLDFLIHDWLGRYIHFFARH